MAIISIFIVYLYPALSVCIGETPGPSIQRVDNFIPWISCFPADNVLQLIPDIRDIYWIADYLFDKVIHPLNNWDLVDIKY